METNERPPTVAEVVGVNAVALRGTYKAEIVARAAKGAGLNWGTGRIADLEKGRVSPTLPTLFMLCTAFSTLLGRPVGLADLLAGKGSVALSDTATVRLADLRAALSGQALGGGVRAAKVQLEPAPESMLAGVSRVRASFLEADARVIEDLGLNAWRGAELMHRLWGRSYSDERDRRGGPEANQQKRGRIARELKAEMRGALHGDDQQVPQ